MITTADASSRIRRTPFAMLLVMAIACAPREADDGAEPRNGAEPDAEASVEVGTTPTPPGGSLDVRARGFPSNATVQIGFGRPNSEYDVIEEVRTNDQGEVNTSVTIPEAAVRGDSYVVVVTTPDHDPREGSDPFVVGSAGDTVRVQGTLERGVECPAIRQPFGALFTLATRDTLEPGTEVRVVGTIAEISHCMQGTTLTVVTIERL